LGKKWVDSEIIHILPGLTHLVLYDKNVPCLLVVTGSVDLRRDNMV
jgi:hypothetical protein